LRDEMSMIWKFRVEDKIKLFMWLLLQNRVRTADGLSNPGRSHDDLCCLCDQSMESAFHLALDCPFGKEVLAIFLHEPELVQASTSAISITDRWILAHKHCNLRKRVSPLRHISFGTFGTRGTCVFSRSSRCFPSAVVVHTTLQPAGASMAECS
jgi:hypothetical protein